MSRLKRSPDHPLQGNEERKDNSGDGYEGDGELHETHAEVSVLHLRDSRQTAGWFWTPEKPSFCQCVPLFL